MTASRGRLAALTVLLVVLSGAWASRAIGIHIALRRTGAVVRNEWVYVDDWIDRQGIAPDAAGVALKRQLQADAISKHPMRPVVLGEWVQWFRE